MRVRRFLSMAGLSVMLGVFGAAVCPGIIGTGFAQAAQEASLEVTMSQKGGIYAEEFLLTLQSQGQSKIYYTLDGSSPITSASRKEYAEPLSITDRSGEANYVSAVDPVKFDAANASWDSKTKTFGDNISAPQADEVDKGTVVKAVAVDAAGNYGTVSTNTYFVGTVAQHIQGAKQSAEAAGIPLSVMSISVDYDDLFDYERGIYVRGKIFDDYLKEYLEQNGTKGIRDKARNIPGNYSQKGKEWERNAHIDYFETDGTSLDCKLQQDCGIRIQGNYSRSDLMKGLRLYARKEYGDNNFRYPFFPDARNDEGKVIDKYKKLTLRNGGNYAFSGTKYNDAFWQSMLHSLDCETQYSRACVVYIDGEYWGLYILQEDYDSDYFEDTHGIQKDSAVVYKASDADEDAAYGYKLDEGNLPQGESDTNYYYKELLNFFDTHEHLVKQSDYEAFTKLVDPQSVMDYFAVNVWVNNKWDWPDKNWSMWKTNTVDASNKYSDGRWRFCIYDLDFGGCSGMDDVYVNTIKEGNYETDGKGLLGQNKTRPMNPALQCFILLMSNQGFREEFMKELDGFSKGILERGQAEKKLDYYRSVYEPLFPQFYTRYFGKDAADKWSASTVIGYAGYENLKVFVANRADMIPLINEYVVKYYEELNLTVPPDNNGDNDNNQNGDGNQNNNNNQNNGNNNQNGDDNPNIDDKKDNPSNNNELKTLKKITVTAKKGKKTIQVKTTAKAKVTVSLSKKIILNGKKKAGKITVTTSKSGVAKVKLSKKLTKGMKVKVSVKKSGYKAKSITVKVK